MTQSTTKIRRACDRCHMQKLSCKRLENEDCERCRKATRHCTSSPSLRNRKRHSNEDDAQPKTSGSKRRRISPRPMAVELPASENIVQSERDTSAHQWAMPTFQSADDVDFGIALDLADFCSNGVTSLCNTNSHDALASCQDMGHSILTQGDGTELAWDFDFPSVGIKSWLPVTLSHPSMDQVILTPPPTTYTSSLSEFSSNDELFSAKAQKDIFSVEYTTEETRLTDELFKINSRACELIKSFAYEEAPLGENNAQSPEKYPDTRRESYSISASVLNLFNVSMDFTKVVGDTESADWLDMGNFLMILSVYLRILDSYERFITFLTSKIHHKSICSQLLWRLPQAIVGSIAAESLQTLQPSLSVKLGLQCLRSMQNSILDVLGKHKDLEGGIGIAEFAPASGAIDNLLCIVRRKQVNLQSRLVEVESGATTLPTP